MRPFEVLVNFFPGVMTVNEKHAYLNVRGKLNVAEIAVNDFLVTVFEMLPVQAEAVPNPRLVFRRGFLANETEVVYPQELRMGVMVRSGNQGIPGESPDFQVNLSLGKTAPCIVQELPKLRAGKAGTKDTDSREFLFPKIGANHVVVIMEKLGGIH